jgi:hypothetical protein
MQYQSGTHRGRGREGRKAKVLFCGRLGDERGPIRTTVRLRNCTVEMRCSNRDKTLQLGRCAGNGDRVGLRLSHHEYECTPKFADE